MAKTKREKVNEIKLTEVEWAIIRVVWQNEPCAAGTVQDALAQTKGWAYSTVKSTMDRMVVKGLLQVQKIRNLHLFSAMVSEVEAKRSELRNMLRRAFDGALTPMMQFLVEHEGLSSDEAEQLRKMAKRAEALEGE